MKRLSLLALLALAACGGRDSNKVDSALATDLALASQVQASQPQFRDSATGVTSTPQRAPQRIDNAPRTRRTTPAVQAGEPAPAAAAPSRVIGAGSSFALASQQRVCTASNRPGDRFVATLTSPVLGSNGAVIPSGSSVVLEVVSLDPGTNNGADGSIRLAVRSVDFNGNSHPVAGDVYTSSELERTRVMADPNSDKKKVIGGAIAGAIVGQMIGKNTKGTVIGAAAGAATGAVAAKATQQFESCLPVGGQMRMTLASALVL